MKKRNALGTALARWVDDKAGLHTTRRSAGAGGAVYAVVESMAGHCRWDWQAWDAAKRAKSRQGVTETLEAAKAAAERAANDIAGEVAVRLTLVI